MSIPIDSIDWRSVVAFIVPSIGLVWTLVNYGFTTREQVRTHTDKIDSYGKRIEKLETNSELMQRQLIATEALAESMKDFKGEVKDQFGDLRDSMMDMAKSQSNIEGFLNRGGKLRNNSPEER